MKHHFPIDVPKSAIEEIACLFIPEDMPPDAFVELAIRIDCTALRVRDFADYLTLIDKIFGHLSSRGIKSYSQNLDKQLKISSVRGHIN